MDLAQATGQPETITLTDGTEVLVRPLKVGEWGKLQAWYKRACPSPVTRAMHALQQLRDDGQEVSLDVEERIMDHAQKAALAWPPRVMSAAWLQALEDAEGAVAAFLECVLGAADPTFAREKAEALAPTIRVEDYREILRVAFFGGNPAPKGGTSAATPAAPTT